MAGYPGRRAAAVVAAAFLGVCTPGAFGESTGRPLDRWERVRVRMEARGELFAPTGEEGGEVRRPFTVTARFDFLEAVAGETPPETVDAGPVVSPPPNDALGVRHFFSAASELSIDRSGDTRRSLAPANAAVIVSSSPAVRHFPTDAFLTREESELLAIAFDPMLLDRLVPPADPPTEEWRPSAELTAALLAIDTVGRPVADQNQEVDASGEAGRLLARVERADDPAEAAKLLVTGTVHGAVDGVPTTIRVDGSYELDGSDRRVKRGLVRLRERRLAGHVSPGFECDATFQMDRRPAEGSRAVPAADEAVLAGMKATWDRLLRGGAKGTHRTLRLEDDDRRFTLVHDARWRAVADDARGLVLRMVDDGALLAECTVSPLPPGEAGTSLDEFRRDIERSLGGRLGRFTASEEKPADAGGVRVLRVVSEGAIDGLPLEWRHHLVEHGTESRTAVTFSIERRFADRFGRADDDLVAGLAPKKGSAP